MHRRDEWTSGALRRPRAAGGLLAEGAPARAFPFPKPARPAGAPGAGAMRMSMVATWAGLDTWERLLSAVKDGDGHFSTILAATLTILVTLLLTAFTLYHARRSAQDDAALKMLADLRTPGLIDELRYLCTMGAENRRAKDPPRPSLEAAADALLVVSQQRQEKAKDQEARETQPTAVGRETRASTETEREKREAEKLVGTLFELDLSMESLGLLVYEGVISIAHVDHIMGHLVTSSWKSVKDYVTHLREGPPQQGNRCLEWYEWLAEQLEKRQRRNATDPFSDLPAHVAFKDWQSPAHWRWRETKGRWLCKLHAKRKSSVPLGLMLLVGTLVGGAIYLALVQGAMLLATLAVALVALLAFLVLHQAPRWPPVGPPPAWRVHRPHAAAAPLARTH